MAERAAALTQLQPEHALAFATAAELTPLPFVLCDANARLYAASRGAIALCGREKVLNLNDGRLVLGGNGRQREMLRLIRLALDGEAPDPRSSELLLKLPRDGEASLSLLVSAVPEQDDELVAVYLHEPLFTARISEKILCRLYELTRAEARVARLLVNGESVQEIAQMNNTSPHTVRNQVKNIFAKTGAVRQAELAILLLSGPAHSR